MTTVERTNYKKSLKVSIKDFDSRNDVTMRNQKIKQLMDVCSDSEKSKLPKWYQEA